MKKRIAIATDFSQTSLNALSKAIYLAKKMQATLDILHVVEYSIFHDPKKDRKAGKEALAKFLAQHYPQMEVEARQFCYVGNIHKEICKHVSDKECSLLCIGATGENHNISKILLGSITKQIIRKSPVPVLIAKSDVLPDYVHAFSPTDFSEGSIKLAKMTKRLFGVDFTFYHLINRPFEIRLSHYGANDEQISKFNQSMEHKAKVQSKKFLDHFFGDEKKNEVVLDSGILSPSRLLEVAESKNASFLVIPTNGKVSFFAMDVLESSHLDVLIWKL